LSLVSCLCPTYGRPAMLRRAVRCFLAQTHAPRELVVVYQAHDAGTRDYLRTLTDPSIRAVEIAPSPHLGPDGLRNHCVQAARGDYVAVWDDDDWSAPTRIQEQLAALRGGGRPGCCLYRVTLFDGIACSAYVSAARAWEQTLVIERGKMPAYANERGGDAALVRGLLQGAMVVALDRPALYVYVYHAANYFNREHWQANLLAHAQPLASAESARVAALLEPGGS
jgi:glycosyltransferase involved in cell wall biosynthesis